VIHKRAVKKFFYAPLYELYDSIAVIGLVDPTEGHNKPALDSSLS